MNNVKDKVVDNDDEQANRAADLQFGLGEFITTGNNNNYIRKKEKTILSRGTIPSPSFEQCSALLGTSST